MYLLERLEDTRVAVRENIVHIFGKLLQTDCDEVTSKRIINGLMKRLQDEDKFVRGATATVIALGNIGQTSDKIIEGLLGRLEDEDEYVRIYTARALGGLGKNTDKAVKGLLRLLGDKEEDVRVASVTALGDMGQTSDEIIKVLSELLKDEYSKIRSAAVIALGKSGKASDEVIMDLLECLKDTDADVRKKAIKALADPWMLDQVNPEMIPRIIKALLMRLEDRDWYVSRTAAELFELVGREIMPVCLHPALEFDYQIQCVIATILPYAEKMSAIYTSESKLYFFSDKMQKKFQLFSEQLARFKTIVELKSIFSDSMSYHAQSEVLLNRIKNNDYNYSNISNTHEMIENKNTSISSNHGTQELNQLPHPDTNKPENPSP